MTHEDTKDLNLQSKEGKLFNAAMAILTTEYQPDMVFGEMFDKVKAIADTIPDEKFWTDEDMVKAYMGGFEQADNYANENGTMPHDWLSEYKALKQK